MLRVFTAAGIFALLLLQTHAAQKILKPNNKYVEVLKKPEQFTPSEWDAILKEKTNFVIDSQPTGKRQVPANAGQAKEGSSAIISSHIIGGTDASRGQLPWQVGIAIDNTWFCGGSLIHSSWVLTAAHCTKNFGTFSMVFGAVNRAIDEINRITRISKTKFVHPNYNAASISNDLGLIRLGTAIPLQNTAYINIIRLPKSSESTRSFVNITATVSGWGLTADGGSTSNILKYLNVPVISNAECIKAFGSQYVFASTLCTTGAKTTGTCNGDSGGPLVHLEADNMWTQIGVVSFGSVQCVSTAPSAYARLTSFLGWISNVTRIAVRK